MSDFLRYLIVRSAPQDEPVKPRVRGLFEPPLEMSPEAPHLDLPGEEDYLVGALDPEESTHDAARAAESVHPEDRWPASDDEPYLSPEGPESFPQRGAQDPSLLQPQPGPSAPPAWETHSAPSSEPPTAENSQRATDALPSQPPPGRQDLRPMAGMLHAPEGRNVAAGATLPAPHLEPRPAERDILREEIPSAPRLNHRPGEDDGEVARTAVRDAALDSTRDVVHEEVLPTPRLALRPAEPDQVWRTVPVEAASPLAQEPGFERSPEPETAGPHLPEPSFPPASAVGAPGVRVMSDRDFRARGSLMPRRAEEWEVPAARDASPDIHISIGRVEVRARQDRPVVSPPSQRPKPTFLSLEEYLKQRNEGRL
ncbi:MAG: hypothetical protein GYB65_19805 [Chloroflexi bacterium]|nr:hypothetical protein [Chloroflexota bacterium]